eukprot:9233284-Pyramimonas_sp.AAC.1
MALQSRLEANGNCTPFLALITASTTGIPSFDADAGLRLLRSERVALGAWAQWLIWLRFGREQLEMLLAR